MQGDSLVEIGLHRVNTLTVAMPWQAAFVIAASGVMCAIAV